MPSKKRNAKLARPNNGGTRPGAGRPAGPGGRKVAMSLRVPQILKDFLKSHDDSEFMMRLALASKEFKAWRKNLDNPE